MADKTGSLYTTVCTFFKHSAVEAIMARKKPVLLRKGGALVFRRGTRLDLVAHSPRHSCSIPFGTRKLAEAKVLSREKAAAIDQEMRWLRAEIGRAKRRFPRETDIPVLPSAGLRPAGRRF